MHLVPRRRSRRDKAVTSYKVPVINIGPGNWFTHSCPDSFGAKRGASPMIQFDTTRKAMTQITVVTGLAMFAATFCASGASPETDPGSGGNAVLVELKGGQITQADLELKRPSAMFQARTNYYEAER